MTRVLSAMIAAIALAAVPMSASAATCKDAKGKFTKCPPAAAKAATTGSVTKDAKGKCHIASGPKKGQFTKCPK